MGLGDLLLENRIVFLEGVINDAVANLLVMKFLYLQYENRTQGINFYINSPGGSVSSTLAIYDTMQYVKCDIRTVVLGQACSMGSLLAQAGTAGKRLILPHARHMIHQPLGGARGQVTDLQIHVNEISRMKKYLTEIYVKHNTKGKTYEMLAADMERDNFMTPEQSVEYGLADKVVTSREEDSNK